MWNRNSIVHAPQRWGKGARKDGQTDRPLQSKVDLSLQNVNNIIASYRDRKSEAWRRLAGMRYAAY
jgi:hypothetical protein